MKNSYRAIIFDLDGTLCETAQDIALSVNQTLMTLGLDMLPFECVVQFIGDGIETLIRRAVEYTGGNLKWDNERMAEIVAQYKFYYDQNLLKHTHPYPGILPTLRRLVNRQLIVISNKSYYFTRRILDKFELSPYFDFILGGDSLLERKPHPYPLSFVLEQYHIAPDEALFIGDSEKDYYAARAVPLPVCLVTYGMRTRAELVKLAPDYLIDRIEELIDIVG
jgi:phosphoglycolate phosphatase